MYWRGGQLQHVTISCGCLSELDKSDILVKLGLSLEEEALEMDLSTIRILVPILCLCAAMLPLQAVPSDLHKDLEMTDEDGVQGPLIEIPWDDDAGIVKRMGPPGGNPGNPGNPGGSGDCPGNSGNVPGCENGGNQGGGKRDSDGVFIDAE